MIQRRIRRRPLPLLYAVFIIYYNRRDLFTFLPTNTPPNDERVIYLGFYTPLP